MDAELTTMCYIERDGCYLMLHRTKKKNDPNHDLWLGPGGHFESNESPEECVIREVREECGITLTKWRMRGIITFSDGDWFEYMFLFTATDFEGEIGECNEGGEGDRIFLRLLAQEHPFFSLKLQYENRRLIRAVLDGESLELN